MRVSLAGYTFPWSPNFVGLAAVIVPTNSIIVVHDGSIVHSFQLVVGCPFIPGFPAYFVCLGYGSDGTQVVCRYRLPLGITG